MIPLKHPSRHYILYLLTRRSMSAEVIAATLAEQGLPVPVHTEQPLKLKEKGKKRKPRRVDTYPEFIDHLRRVQRSLDFPPGFHPLRKNHEPSQVFLKRLGVADFWRQDPFTMAAFEYLSDPHICRMLKTMLLGPLGLLAISRRLAEKFGLPATAMNPQVIRAFAHYFWDYDALDRAEWDRVLWDWVTGDTTDYHIALKSPRSSVGAAMVLHITDQGGSESLKEVLTYRFGRDANFMEIVRATIGMSTGVAKATTMMMHTQAMIQHQDQLDLRRGGSAELLEELRRIEATYDPRKLTTVKDLPLHQLPPGYIDVEYEEMNDDSPQ
ncbi:MAG: hypothetical protein DRQ64_00020 [Gammaproteobacteria bacterium]|nr:MAG: hypothetical protein DRQ64_00020 [Gammaproteobacteria bacterium]